MKQLFVTAIAIGFLASCNNAPVADKAQTSDKQEVTTVEGTGFTIDLAESKVGWTGTKVGGSHNGTFGIQSGSLAVKENALTGGSFTIDMASLADLDLAGEDKGKLEGHLKSPDFFDVAKYPTAKFEITNISAADAASLKDAVLKDATHIIQGNLTLKDSTKNVTFPAKVSVTDAGVTAAANFNIDRAAWGIVYDKDTNPKDWVISNMVNIKLDIKADKK
ncbi:MAG: YceI family protein [Chitinophagaceae bacterium]